MALPVDRWDAALDVYFRRKMLDIHTNIPAKVVNIDYSKGKVDVQVLVELVSPISDVSALNYTYPTILDVPLHIYSAKGGKAKITVPVSIGDVGLLYFPEKDMEGFKGSLVRNKKENSVTHTAQGIYFVPEMSTEEAPISIDPDNIVIEFVNSKFTMQPDGNVFVNGANITPDGNVITKAGVDLNQFKAEYDAHYHDGVATGMGQTSLPKP